MPLNKKYVSHHQKNLLSWVCCLPCVPCGVLLGLCLNHCCDNEEVLDLACYPCADSESEKNAKSIASKVTQILNHSDSALITYLEIKGWDYAKDLDYILIVHNAIYKQVYNILNNYNFGIYDSTDLKKPEKVDISEQIKKALILAFPTKSDFEKLLQEKNIHDEKEIHEFFIGAILSIVNRKNFIFDQMNIISGAIESERAKKTAVNAEALQARYQGTDGKVSKKGMFKPDEAAGLLKVSVVTHPKPESAPPPYNSPGH